MVLHETEDGDFDVVDGKQRLTSLISFVDGELPTGKPFRLKDLDEVPELNGMGYGDLPVKGRPYSQSLFDKFTISCVIIKHGSDPGAVFTTYERINNGACNLNAQQLRRGVYHGSYYDLLDHLAAHPLMLERRGKTFPFEVDPLEKDRELILRVLAMHRSGPEEYAQMTRASMKKFLNQQLCLNRNLSPEELFTLESTFDFALTSAMEIFGKDAFKRISSTDGAFATSNEISAVTFEVQMVTLATLADTVDLATMRAQKGALRAAWCDLLGDGDFRALLRSSSKAAVVERLARAQSWLSAVT